MEKILAFLKGFKGVLVMVSAFLVIAAILFGGGFYCGRKSCPEVAKKVVIKSADTPKPKTVFKKIIKIEPKKDMKACGDRIDIKLETAGDKKIKGTASDTCKSTTAYFDVTYFCKYPSWHIQINPLIFVSYSGKYKTLDTGPGLELAYIHSYGKNIGVGGSFAYAQGLMDLKNQLFIGKFIFQF